MGEQYKLIAIKRKYIPEWLFFVMSVPIDFISPKWLPFRYLFTTPIE